MDDEDKQILEKYPELKKALHRIKRKELTFGESNIPSYLDDPSFSRLYYARYVDDFIIGFIGNKEDAKEIKKQVEEFLLETLALNCNSEKSFIQHSKEITPFLGFELR
jgi:hypothetical protein